MYMAELYEIPEDAARDIPMTTIREAFDYAEKHGGTRPTSVSAALEAIQ